MEFSNLFADDDAVSPVIGVILMVAITVILAAVIGTFVLGLGDQVSNTSPSASFTFDFEDSYTASNTDCDLTTNGELTITHDGGDEINGDQLDITDGTNTVEWKADCDSGATDVSAGNQITVGTTNDDTVRVVWSASSGGDTATLGKWTGPQA